MSYDGVTVASLDIGSAILTADSDDFQAEAIYLERPGAASSFGSASFPVRVYQATFTTGVAGDEAADAAARAKILGFLQWPKIAERTLVVTHESGTTGTAPATVQKIDVRGPGRVLVEFAVSAPFWEEAGEAFAGGGAITSVQRSFAVENAGHVVANPIIDLSWTTQRTTKSSAVGWQYRRRFTVTNPAARTMKHYAVHAPAFDSAALIAGGKAQSDGDDVRIWINGEDVPTFRVNWGSEYCHVWFVIDELGPGQTLTVDLMYGNASATSGQSLSQTSNRAKYLPAMDIRGDYGQASSGASGSLTDSTKSWTTNYFARAWVRITSGTGAGQEREIASNNATVLTLVSTWTTAPDNTSKYVIYRCTNIYHLYYTAIDNVSTVHHGGWFGTNMATAGSTSFETPHAWRRTRVLKNDDIPEQQRSILLNNGTTNRYYRIFSAKRRSGNYPTIREGSVYDGVMISNPFGFSAIRFSASFRNDNGMGKALVGYREANGDQWDTVYSSTSTSTGSHAAISTASYALTDAYQLCFATLPADDALIPLSVPGSEYAEFRWGDQLRLTINGGPTLSSLASEVEVYEAAATLRLGYDTILGPTPPYQIMSLGYAAGADRRLAIPSGYTLRVDCRRGTVALYNGSTFIEWVPWSVLVNQYQLADDGSAQALLTEDWFPVPALANPVPNPTALSDLTGWTDIFEHANATADWTRDASTFQDAAGSFKCAVSANTVSGGVLISTLEGSNFPLAADDVITLYAAARSASANLDANLRIAFYDGGDSLISSYANTIKTTGLNTWEPLYATTTAPANTVNARVRLEVYSDSSGATGDVFFDRVAALLPVIWYDDTVGSTIGRVDLEARLQPGYVF